MAFEYVQKLIMQRNKKQSLGEKKIIVVLTSPDVNICSLVCVSDHIEIFDVPF